MDTSQVIQMSKRAQRLDQRNTSKDTAQTDTRLRNAHDDVPNPKTPSVCESRVEITGDQFLIFKCLQTTKVMLLKVGHGSTMLADILPLSSEDLEH